MSTSARSGSESLGAAVPRTIGTGVGSMPGTDPRAAAEVVNGELDLAHLVELPARGVGADMIGRMAGILVDLPVDTTVTGYRLAPRPSRVGRRASDHLRTDLDAVEELWDAAGFIGTGRAFKIQVCGPFTFAASTELVNGHKVIRDRGAWSDVVASTAEGIDGLVAECRRRLGAEVVVQLDEPLIGAVIDGTVTPLTRYDPIRAVPVSDVAQALSEMIATVGRPTILHNCNAPRWDLAAALPGVAFGVDISSPGPADLDGIGMLVDRGERIVVGVVAATGTDRITDSSAERAAGRVAQVFDRIGLPRKLLADRVIVAPDCGLAGAGEARAKAVLSLCARAGELLATDPEALS